MPTYYFSSTNGNDTRTALQAQNQATPWQSITKHNSTAFAAGDVVSFQRGDTFVGSLDPDSGSSGSPITYTAHGTGADPVITGLSTLTSWTSTSNPRIFYATVDVPRLQVVVLDGTIRGMGRYPNSGYLQYTDHVKNVVSVASTSALPAQTAGVMDWVVYIAANTGTKYRWNGTSYVPYTYPFGVGTQAIFGTTIGALPFDPINHEAVVRKDRYYVDRQNIISRSGNWLNLGKNNDWGANDQNATNNNGFFIQGGIPCLDQDGDWYYDKTAKRLYMYFTASNVGRTVQASLFPIGINAVSKSYLNFRNLKLVGYNISGIDGSYGGRFDISLSGFEKIGGNGIEGIQGIGYITINANNFSDCLNCGTAFYEVNNVVITDNVVDRIHMIQGMGKSGDAAGNGLHFFGDNQTVTGNRVTNCGFNGISFYGGNNVLIEKNFVRRFCLLKDDGAGIYTYGNFAQTFVNRNIRKNVVVEGIGSNNVAADGLGFYVGYQEYGMVFAVYLDNFATQVTVEDNTLFSCSGGGVFVNLWGYNSILNNLIFDGKYGIAIANWGNVRGMVVTGNTVVAKNSDQICLYVVSYNGLSDIANIGTFNNNLYSRPVLEGATIGVSNGSSGDTFLTLPQWKANYGKDATSTASVVTTDSPSKIRSDYNYSPNPSTISLGGVYKDLAGATLSGSEIIQAYDGSVKIWQSDLVSGGGKILMSPSGKILTHNGKILFRS